MAGTGKMTSVDYINISQSEIVDHGKFSELPLDRLELFKGFIYPRMIYYKGAFRSHLDVLNLLESGVSWADAGYESRRNLYSIWNLPGFSGIHLSNYLLPYGITTKVINNFDAEFDLFCEAYKNAGKPPLVGISTTFYMKATEIRRLLTKIRSVFTDVEVVVGGAFISAEVKANSPEWLHEIMLKYGINYAIHSVNSEEDLKALIDWHRKGKKGALDHIKNLAYLAEENGALVVRETGEEWHGPNLSEPPAKWHELELPFLRSTIQMRTSAGCAFSCAFCSYPEIAGGFFHKPVDDFERHLVSVLKIPGINKVIFLDDTPNTPRKRWIELCKMFAKHDFEWFSFLRVQFVDDEVARLMKESGCVGVFLGIESANNEVLKNMNKKATREKFASGMASLRKYGIMTMASLVYGFPGETDETIEQNVQFIEEMGFDYYSIKEFLYLENTPIYERREEFGLQGNINKWSHNTMDSARTLRHKLNSFKRIKKSQWVDPDISLWYLAYLYDLGFDLEQINQIQTQLNEIMLSQMEGEMDDAHPGFARILEVLESREHIEAPTAGQKNFKKQVEQSVKAIA